MKKLLLALLCLTSCASAPETSPESADGLLPPPEASAQAEATLSSDSGLGSTDSFLADEAGLATPVEPEVTAQPSPPTPPPPPAPSPVASPAPEEPAPTAAQAQEPAALPPVVQGATAGDTRGARQRFREYQDRLNTKAESEASLDEAALFPHEDGAFQLGIDYTHDALNGLDFDSTSNRVINPATQSGQLSLAYFPLRSIDLGRLGIGIQGAGYWSRYEYASGIGSETSKVNSARSFGGKLQYEFQYFIGQILVPFVQYGYDQISLRAFDRSASGFTVAKRTFGSSFYGGGVHFNLNRLEPSAASKSLASSGVRKFYLTYNYLYRTYDSGGGANHVLGLRFEY